MTVVIRPWSVSRARFNHDWLKNHYITAIDFWIECCAENEIGSHPRHLVQIVTEWDHWRSVAAALLDEAEEALSPQRLFHEAPLNRCASDMRGCLSGLSHRLWLTRSGIREMVDDARKVVAEFDSAYAVVISVGAITPGARDAIIRLRDCCREVAGAFERLPHVADGLR